MMGPFKYAALAAVLTASGLMPQRGGQYNRPARSGESCTTGQDMIVQALEKLTADSKPAEIEDANQSLRRALDMCAESGDAWYYRSLVEAKLNHALQAALYMKHASEFSSEALREGLNPFVLATPAPGKVKPDSRIHNRWALVVGISDFSDQRISPLGYTTADATAFKELLVDPKLGGFPSDNVHLLTNEKANLYDIKRELNWIARSADPNDLAVIFIASHGMPRSSDQVTAASYILAHDTKVSLQQNIEAADADTLAASALPMEELSDDVATRLKALRTAIFLDTCFSGGVINKSKGTPTLKDAGLSKATLRKISQGTGRVIFAASGENEESREDGALGGGHGYFTYYLLEALRKDPSKPLSQVFDYVQQHVSSRVAKDYALTNQHQTPVFSRSADDADFALGAGSAPAVASLAQVEKR